MARMTIFNPNMLKLLPQFMRGDEANAALSQAMDALLAEPAKRSRILRKWDQIDNMNHAQLDEMAWEFNIDWWDSAFSLETKRAVVKSCYRVHEKRGTKWAVEELITSAFGMGKVTPWFEYDRQSEKRPRPCGNDRSHPDDRSDNARRDRAALTQQMRGFRPFPRNKARTFRPARRNGSRLIQQ